MRRFLLVSILCIVAASYAQNEQNLDSWYSTWKDESQNDSIRIISLYKYVWVGFSNSNPDTTIYFAEKMKDFSERKKNNFGIMTALHLKATSLTRTNDFQSALKAMYEVLRICKEMNDRRGIAATLAGIGSIYQKQGNYITAIKVLLDSQAMIIEMNDKELLINNLNSIGMIYDNQGAYSKSLDYYRKSLRLAEEMDSQNDIANAKHNIGTIYSHLGEHQKALEYYNESRYVYQSTRDNYGLAQLLSNVAIEYEFLKKYDSAIYFNEKSLKISKDIQDYRGLAFVYNNFGNIYDKLNDLSKALDYFEKSLKISKEADDRKLIIKSLVSIGSTYSKLDKNTQAISLCGSALEIAKELESLPDQKSASNCLYNSYKAIGNSDEALNYLEHFQRFSDSLKTVDTAKKLQRMEFEKQVLADSLLQVEKELKIEVAHQKEKNKLTWGWGGSLSAISIFAFIVFRNVKQKQRKAEEERQKQIEEKEKILKDLELQTIDAMIAGQEKERQRLAADLHDSVGATLAAAKLQFNHLIKDEIDNKIREELIKKTSTLLEDAYVEIRSMAHLKNAGVIAKNGLLPAVKNLTDNASGINGLAFEVQSFGLEQRLDNSLEISIFRIIQELVTNIIKHANATKSVVYLTNHDNNLNVMIEDNGKGFNPKHVKTNKSGMGIASIDKRVEHLHGKLSIESEKNIGTTVIIDIPL